MMHDNGLCTSDQNESKRKWKHPYVLIAKGMKSSPNVRST
jgi:hypothetical protein